MTRRSTTHRSPARFIARMLQGAKAAPHPRFVLPCEPSLVQSVPAGDRWLHEIKFDGYRLQAQLQGGRAVIYTRRGFNWTARFPTIAQALEDLPANDLVLDGEIIVPNEHGQPSYDDLLQDLNRGAAGRFQYVVFDCLYLDGFDLRPAPLSKRQRVLAAFLEPHVGQRLALSLVFETDGNRLLQMMRQSGLEGIVSKLRDAPYRSGRSKAWLKTKCTLTASFVIIGFVPDGSGIGALRLARRDGPKLVYVGKVGTGFSARTSREVRAVLDGLVVDRPAVPLRKAGTTWIEPRRTARIAYRAITADGLLRHPSFKGLD